MGKKKAARQELLPGTLDMLILKTPRRAASCTATASRSTSGSCRTRSCRSEEGSLYPALQRLQLQGLIASEWGHSVNNRRARYYRLTRAGRSQLGDVESSFARLIEAITRVMRPA